MLSRLKNVIIDIRNIITGGNELAADHATFRTVTDDLKTLANDIRRKLQGNYVVGVAALAIGSTTTDVASAAFDYFIAGKKYAKAAVAAGTPPGNDVVPVNKFGAVAFDIGVDGAIDAVEATGNAAGYDTAAAAVLGLPLLAAGHARIGWVTAKKSDGGFTFGTTDLNAANTTVAYTDAPTMFNAIGAEVASSPPAALSSPTLNQKSY